MMVVDLSWGCKCSLVAFFFTYVAELTLSSFGLVVFVGLWKSLRPTCISNVIWVTNRLKGLWNFSILQKGTNKHVPVFIVTHVILVSKCSIQNMTIEYDHIE